MVRSRPLTYWLLEAVPWLAVAAALAAAGFTMTRRSGDVRTTETPSPQAATSTPPPARTVAKKPPRRVAAPPARAAGAATVVRIRTSRGPCWLEARLDSSLGKLLYRRLLSRGRTLQLRAAGRIWIRLGAGANVDVDVNGRRRRVGRGIVSVTVGRTTV
jgi:hypothetical protein